MAAIGDILIGNMAKRNTSPRPNTMAPLGMSPGVRRNPANLVKVTDNSEGWSSVAGIAVPPESTLREFTKPLNMAPVLLNGAQVVSKEAMQKDVVSEPAPLQNTDLPKEIRGEPTFPPDLSFTSQDKTIELDWYGARIVVPCSKVLIQPADPARNNQGWMLVEMTLNTKTGKPSWLPPVALFENNGKIGVPEFTCTVDNKDYTCQVLNIELWDRDERKYFVLFRLLD